MQTIARKLIGLLAAGGVAAAFSLAGGTTALAAGDVTCHGPLNPGTYASLTVPGFCAIRKGDVTVTGNVTVAPGGILLAAFNGSNLTVGRNLVVQTNGVLVLGCEPFASPCFNDPDQQTGTPGFITHDVIGGNLIGDGALMILAHANVINGNVSQSGGGGGVNCEPLPFGPPAFSTYEDNTVGGNLIVEGLHTCWDGSFRNHVGGNLIWNDNVTWDGTPITSQQDTLLHGDDDGNEISGNFVHGNLNCSGNFPAVQFGDSAGVPNTVTGRVNGQCTAVV